MTSDDDPLLYYRALGLAPTATQAQIQHAYREWAKNYHPDASGNNDASGFYKIKQAYDTLKDQALRARYDMLGRKRTSREGPEHSESARAGSTPKTPIPAQQPSRCVACGLISAQPRYCIFSRVTSVVFYTSISHLSGVLCPKCAARKSVAESAFSWLFGWWSVLGIFETPLALWRNAALGDKPKRRNAHLLMSQAHYFRSIGDNVLAQACLQQAGHFAEGEDVEAVFNLKAAFGNSDGKVVKDRWSRQIQSYLLFHTAPFVVVFLIIFVSSYLHPAISAIGQTVSSILPHTPTSATANAALLPKVKDIRHVAVETATIWIVQSGQYVNGGFLPQYSTLQVLGPTNDPKFVNVILSDGATATIAASFLSLGDGPSAYRLSCRRQTLAYPRNGEALRHSLQGPHHVTLTNSGTDDAVVKFRAASGEVVVTMFIAANSQASINDFPDGVYQLSFATGRNWSRQCGMFSDGMRSQRFPTPDTFASWTNKEITDGRVYSVTHFQNAQYTITPILNGNVQAESISEDAFTQD